MNDMFKQMEELFSKVDNLTNEVNTLKKQHKQEINNLEKEHKKEINNLKDELNEKDKNSINTLLINTIIIFNNEFFIIAPFKYIS